MRCAPSSSHRHLSHIREIVDGSDLADSVKQCALQTFERLARAEGKVHNISPEKVHFHEVGATDAIVDIVGSAVALEYLQPDRVFCGPVELGSGMVRCEHGMMPVPAPATAELLLNSPTTRGRVNGEATTPTGAAILAQHVDSFDYPPDFRAARVGYGLGTEEL